MRVPFLLPLPVLLFLSWSPPSAHAAPGDQPLRVTTDGVAYCRYLASRLAALQQPQPAVDSLRMREALDLCESGHARSGIARLRRMLREAQPRR